MTSYVFSDHLPPYFSDEVPPTGQATVPPRQRLWLPRPRGAPPTRPNEGGLFEAAANRRQKKDLTRHRQRIVGGHPSGEGPRRNPWPDLPMPRLPQKRGRSRSNNRPRKKTKTQGKQGFAFWVIWRFLAKKYLLALLCFSAQLMLAPNEISLFQLE